MCPHVMCLSLIAPPPTPLLSPHKLPLFTFFSSLLCICISNFSLSYSLDPKTRKLSISSANFISDQPHTWISAAYPVRTMKARRRMCNSSSLKREFLKKWVKGLEICRNIKKDASNILERKNAIKLSADVAIAATRNATTRWRRALLNDVVSRDRSNEVLVEHVLGGQRVDNSSRLKAYSRRILRRSRIGIASRRRATRSVVPKSSKRCSSSNIIAKKLVKSRTLALQKVVPGGEEMDGVSLLQETLDYIISLRLQIDVMRHVAAAAATT